MSERADSVSIPNLFAGSLTELMHPPAGQIPFLDGLRSIAILLVVSGHLSADFAGRYGSTVYSRLPFVANGWIGVDLFFVLSGFFIGGQLWKEQIRRGTVDVGRFMLRRGFRIWPLYYFFFVVVLSVSLLLGTAPKTYGWSDLVFLTNYVNHGIVEGSWSLCTEEQFYIVTPLAIYFFARHLRAVERCRPWLWTLLCLVPLLRAAIWIHGTGHFFSHDAQLFSPIYYRSITHCDGLIIGLIIANLWETRTQPKSKLANPWLLVLFGTFALVALHVLQKEIFDFSALALFFGSFVWLGVQRHVGVFDSRLFYWISRLSFGMYLNHEYIATWVVERVLPHLGLSRSHLLANLFGVVVLATISAAVALVTFCLVEHPFLQLRKIVLAKPTRAQAGDFTAVTR
jgi:peptidoglycan/LPS O-acetylase OafA/YrhL